MFSIIIVVSNPTDKERHVDPPCWMIAASQVMSNLYSLIRPKATNSYLEYMKFVLDRAQAQVYADFLRLVRMSVKQSNS